MSEVSGRAAVVDDRGLAHRGPNDEHIHCEPGLALGVRRLSVIDVANGRQPLSNESGDVWVAYEGELYEYPEIREQLLARGHRLLTHCDTEAWVHLYEDLGEKVFGQTHGQYGVSLWDRERRTVYLARDRIGISPLFYAEADGWFLWASEIKSLLASGLIEARPDIRGLDYFFNFFCLRLGAPPSRASTRCRPAISSASARADGRSSATGISIFRTAAASAVSPRTTRPPPSWKPCCVRPCAAACAARCR